MSRRWGKRPRRRAKALRIMDSSGECVLPARRIKAEPTPQPPPCREGEEEASRSWSVPLVEKSPTPRHSFSPSLQGGGWGVGSENSDSPNVRARSRIFASFGIAAPSYLIEPVVATFLTG